MQEMIYSFNSKRNILDEGFFTGYHYCILSLGTHPCAYVEIPKDHKYYGKNYLDMNINCHGGLTFSSQNGLPPIIENGFWIGWDYNHFYDYNGLFVNQLMMDFSNRKRWTTQEILDEVKSVIFQLKGIK